MPTKILLGICLFNRYVYQIFVDKQLKNTHNFPHVSQHLEIWHCQWKFLFVLCTFLCPTHKILKSRIILFIVFITITIHYNIKKSTIIQFIVAIKLSFHHTDCESRSTYKKYLSFLMVINTYARAALYKPRNNVLNLQQSC